MAKRLTQVEFIEKAKEIHGDKYDYSKVNYVNNITKVCIVCPIHGVFYQAPVSHLNGRGCKKCGQNRVSDKLSMSSNDFIKKAVAIHGKKYDYSKVEYKNNRVKVCIICPTHGEFWQTPNHHLLGHGCKKCQNEFNRNTQKKSLEYFVSEAQEVHNNGYDYSKVNYINNKTKVCIVCPKHGEFWMTPKHHLHGHGCPICNRSNLEKEIEFFLADKNIDYQEFVKKDVLFWLNRQHLDFYLPQYNVAIECQGRQHYEPANFGSKKLLPNDMFRDIQYRDQRKKELCKENGVKLLYFTHYDGIEADNVETFKDKEKLLEAILTT